MFTVVMIAITVAYFGSIFGALTYSELRKRKLKALYEADLRREGAITGTLEVKALRAAPGEWKARLQGKVTTVKAIPAVTGSRGADNAGATRYESFVIDANGDAHALQHHGDADEVAAEARWVADLLDVPFTDQTS